ncbi:unnamed protein product [Cochlearia groenlandica]
MKVVIFSRLVLILASLVLPSIAQDRALDYVTSHSEARAAVGIAPIKSDERVAAFARAYADRLKENCNLVHSGGPYGESLAMSSGNLSGIEAVELWVDERANYNYASNTCKGVFCGHYTQVVWRNSVRVGCAKVRCNNGGTIIVCNYDPRGNYVNQKPY